MFRINGIRNAVAAGLLVNSAGESVSFPGTNQLAELIWDQSLALRAQIWADQHQNTLLNLEERTTDDGTSYGQNIFVYQEPVANPTVIKDALDKWLDEGKMLQTSEIDYFTGESTEIWNFTQLIWQNTQIFGCGMSQWQADGYCNAFLVCNFWPGGNIPGEPIYIKS